MKYSVTGFLVLIALYLLPSLAPAQQGPHIPCLDCPQLKSIKPYPFSGNWHNPESFEGGFMFEIQNGRLGGIFHHYDQDGDPTWAVIIGTLQSGEGEVLWKLETELGMVEGGTCIGCPSQQPQPAGSAGTIQLEFLHRNYGRYRIDDGEWQYIVPLLFGVAGNAVFAPHSDQLLPDLGGFGVIVPPGVTIDRKWTLAFRYMFGPGNFVYFHVPARFSGPQTIEDGIRYTLSYNLNNIGQMVCLATGESGPLCTLELDISGPPALKEYLMEPIKSATYIIHPGNIGPQRFEGESEDGFITLVGMRTGFD